MKPTTTAMALEAGFLPASPRLVRAQEHCCEPFRTRRGGEESRGMGPCWTPRSAMAVGRAMALDL